MPTTPAPDDRQIAGRLRAWRTKRHIGQAAFARAIGIKPGALWTYESGKVPLKARAALSAWRKLDLNPAWLRSGDGPQTLKFTAFGEPFARILDPPPHQDFSDFYDATLMQSDFRDSGGEALSLVPEFNSAMVQSGWRLRERSVPGDAIDYALQPWIKFLDVLMEYVGWAKTNSLDNVSRGIHFAPVQDIPNSVDQLLLCIRGATAAPGAKKELARRLGVRQQQLSVWLSPKGKRPSADYALALLNWLTSAKAKPQKKTPAVVETQPARKAKSRQLRHAENRFGPRK